jgi:hypothetical protein
MKFQLCGFTGVWGCGGEERRADLELVLPVFVMFQDYLYY